jgi:hypothetical protein
MSPHSPVKWDLEHIRAFLEQQENTEQINYQTIRTVETFFAQLQVDKGLLFLLSGLSPKLQINLLHSVVKDSNQPNRDDWINILKSVQYEFKTSQHYWGILLISALLSIFAVFGLWHTASSQPIGAVTGVMGFAVAIIGVFWWVLVKKAYGSFEPNLFIRLGVLGLQTYSVELHALHQNRLVWPEIEVLAFAVPSSVAVAFAIGTVLVFLIVFGFFLALITIATGGVIAIVILILVDFSKDTDEHLVEAVAKIIASIVDFTFSAARTVGSARTIGSAVAVAVAVAGAIAVVFAFTNSYSYGFIRAVVAAYGIGILGGLGVKTWYQCKDEPDARWRMFFAALALPWFCITPIVLIFAVVGLTSLFTSLAFLPIPPWLSAGLLELFLVGVSSWLWRRGQKLDAMARNPLQGGLIEETLRLKYGRPRT